jgi:hypothetical protein
VSVEKITSAAIANDIVTATLPIPRSTGRKINVVPGDPEECSFAVQSAVLIAKSLETNWNGGSSETLAIEAVEKSGASNPRTDVLGKFRLLTPD